MLILTRKKDESIIINNDIVIQVIGIEDGKVKLGIEAPKSVSIHRSEIHEKIKESNLSSTVENVNLSKLTEIYQKNKK